MTDLYLCACEQFYDSHPPDCPARRQYEAAQAANRRIREAHNGLLEDLDAALADNEQLQADNERLRRAMLDWKQRIKKAGKRQCPTCYSIYCDIGIDLADTGEKDND